MISPSRSPQPHPRPGSTVCVDKGDAALLQGKLESVEPIRSHAGHTIGALSPHDRVRRDTGAIRQCLRGPSQEGASGSDLRPGQHRGHAAPPNTGLLSRAQFQPQLADYPPLLDSGNPESIIPADVPFANHREIRP